VVPVNAAQVILGNCSNVTIQDLEISNIDHGIQIGHCSDVSVANNNITGTTDKGIHVGFSQNITVSNNSISQGWEGIVLYGSDHSLVENNTLYRVMLTLWNSDNNTIRHNDLFASGHTIDIHGSINNFFHHNNIESGIVYSFDNSSFSNFWSKDGEGNYWHDYKGSDDGSDGRIAGDGIGDTEIPHPYTDRGDGYFRLDYYPLVEPIGGVSPTSNVENISPYWQKSYPLNIEITADDVGSGVQNVTLWYRYSWDNEIWGDWTVFDLDSESPWSISFDFPDGEGYYEFYSIGEYDSEFESTPTLADSSCTYDD